MATVTQLESLQIAKEKVIRRLISAAHVAEAQHWVLPSFLLLLFCPLG